MPGLVCTHSHIGGIGGADRSAPIQPDVRIYDSINVHDSGFKRALAYGLHFVNFQRREGMTLSRSSTPSLSIGMRRRNGSSSAAASTYR